MRRGFDYTPVTFCTQLFKCLGKIVTNKQVLSTFEEKDMFDLCCNVLSCFPFESSQAPLLNVACVEDVELILVPKTDWSKNCTRWTCFSKTFQIVYLIIVIYNFFQLLYIYIYGQTFGKVSVLFNHGFSVLVVFISFPSYWFLQSLVVFQSKQHDFTPKGSSEKGESQGYVTEILLGEVVQHVNFVVKPSPTFTNLLAI